MSVGWCFWKKPKRKMMEKEKFTAGAWLPNKRRKKPIIPPALLPRGLTRAKISFTKVITFGIAFLERGPILLRYPSCFSSYDFFLTFERVKARLLGIFSSWRGPLLLGRLKDPAEERWYIGSAARFELLWSLVRDLGLARRWPFPLGGEKAGAYSPGRFIKVRSFFLRKWARGLGVAARVSPRRACNDSVKTSSVVRLLCAGILLRSCHWHNDI